MNAIELDLPVALAAAPFDTVGKTVGAVVNLISARLRKAELEPEWVIAANWVNGANDSVAGLKAEAAWPDRVDRDRLCLSVTTGPSEGWLVQIDHVRLHAAGDSGHWSSVPLVRIKTLTRSHAWAVAAAVSRMLDID
ncbi:MULTISPECIES: hypothetical protein [Paraburkholderia]|uniref:hypothetical protein n=1 Tax=Paraburkholderia TaxID=1822464 RepID=UPI002AB2CCB8|nr:MULTISPECIES: hypothetical protein [Paraburkholderia]